MPNTYDLGDTVRLSAPFRDAAGVAFDPTAVKCSLLPPNGETETYTYPADAEIVRDGEGDYHLDVFAALSGIWQYRWFNDAGQDRCAGEGVFVVRPSEFGL